MSKGRHACNENRKLINWLINWLILTAVQSALGYWMLNSLNGVHSAFLVTFCV